MVEGCWLTKLVMNASLWWYYVKRCCSHCQKHKVLINQLSETRYSSLFPSCFSFNSKKLDHSVISILGEAFWDPNSQHHGKYLPLCDKIHMHASLVISNYFGDPMDCSLPGPSIHGIFQARILKWVAIFLLQWFFLIQGLNRHLLCLLYCRKILFQLSHCGSPIKDTFASNHSVGFKQALHQRGQKLTILT